jgi:hypothetical protein
MNKHLASAKKFVVDHKVAIAVTVTTIVLSTVHVKVIANHNDFLEKHDLLEEFYAMNEED